MSRKLAEICEYTIRQKQKTLLIISGILHSSSCENSRLTSDSAEVAVSVG